jgi:peptide-methionine (R)-S-oxide reductase
MNTIPSDEQLQSENPELYRIARTQGTEPAFTGKYVDDKQDGMYHCAVCDVELFSSTTKFDSGSGWPSFTDPVTTDSVELRNDSSIGMNRTEVICKNCKSHLGHVFPDGPIQKNNLKHSDRYCVNSISLELKPKTESEKEYNNFQLYGT